MSVIEKTIVYFGTPGRSNTEAVLASAKKRAEELGIKSIVVASTTGETGVKASQVFKGFNLVVVTHHTGFKEPGQQELTEENRRIMEANGVKVYTGTHVFMNVERAIRSKFDTAYPAEIMAQTLRLFCEGMKVAVEIVAMAADAGLIPVDRDVVSIAGTGRGADTAIVVQPANSSRIFDMIIKEIIAKPLSRI
ncbi:MAG: pyruvate kinase alpha/beta domain-containing protein [Thermoproteota archaeon]